MESIQSNGLLEGRWVMATRDQQVIASRGSKEAPPRVIDNPDDLLIVAAARRGGPAPRRTYWLDAPESTRQRSRQVR
jgi:hypothetical protein